MFSHTNRKNGILKKYTFFQSIFFLQISSLVIMHFPNSKIKQLIESIITIIVYDIDYLRIEVEENSYSFQSAALVLPRIAYHYYVLPSLIASLYRTIPNKNEKMFIGVCG